LNIRIESTLKNGPLLNGLSGEEIQLVVNAATRRHFKSGEKICTQGQVGESMFIILSGRVRMSVHKDDGNEQALSILQQGNHFGELVLLVGGRRTATATALMDTEVLEIAKQDFYALVKQAPDFLINLSRTISGWLCGELAGKVTRNRLGIIGLISTSALTSHFAQQITQFFIGKNKKIEIFSDRTDYWKSMGFESVHAVPCAHQRVGAALLQQDLTEAAEQCNHVFVDIRSEQASQELLMQCEHVWWFVEQKESDGRTQVEQIGSLLKQQSKLANRLQIVWVQPKSNVLAKVVPHHVVTNSNEMRFAYNIRTNNLRPADLARLYHAARGVHLGLALGGGGAHGLAHIGVIAALEENGLFFDRIAGTSAGAIIAGGYGAGFNQKHLLKLFNKEIKSPKFMSFIPKESKWYLLGLFRLGLIEQRLRKYLKHITIEQLLLPVHMISVDLISGKAVIRSQGDVVNSILESINYPIFSKPIFRDGLALVDGGVLINVPSSVLRNQQAGYIVGVDVGAILSANFGKNTAQMRAVDMKPVSYLSTLNRVLDVSAKELAKLHMSESDFLITPDTSSCPFEDFTRGEQLFDIGYNATQAVMPELKQSYEDFVEQE